MEQNYTKIEHELPLIPLRGLAIFPYMILNFDVGREISLKALDAGALNDDLVFLTSQKEAETDEPTTDDFYHVGTICKIKQMIKLPGNTVRVLVEGISRGKIKEVGMDEEEGYFKAIIEEVAYDAENADEDAEVEAFVRNVFDAFEEYINIGNRVSPEILISLADIDNVDRFIDTIAANIYLKPDQKQSILEEFDVKKRLELIYTILLEEIEILKIEKKITLRVKKQMNKVQKEYYLREQLKAIQKELGDDEDINSEADEYREKLNKIKAPKETKEKIAKEINKFSKISPMSPDVSVSRTYLDTVFSLPWNKETRDKIDLEKAKEILDDEHYDLGYNVIGLDLSDEMLTVASSKQIKNAMFIKGDMTNFELPHKVDCCVCSLDSINHLKDIVEVKKCFDCVYNSLNDGGVFVFDVNTVYKHKNVLGNNTFVFDEEDFFLSWDNEYLGDNTVRILLDFFVYNGKNYDRFSEEFNEKAYSVNELKSVLNNFNIIGIYDELNLDDIKDDSERIYFVLKKGDN